MDTTMSAPSSAMSSPAPMSAQPQPADIQSIPGSYVDNYTPPQTSQSSISAPPLAPATTMPEPIPAPVTQSVPSPDPAPQPIQAAPVTPATPPAAPQPVQAKSENKTSQLLEDQNIFTLLGIQQIPDQEKESFLNELQQVIWDDFVENDVDLLLTEEELASFRKIADKKELAEEDRQAEMIDFLEKLIPDLEKIMLEKALELKEEMTRERINDLKQVYASQADKLDKVNKAAQLIDSQQWRAAADALNTIK